MKPKNFIKNYLTGFFIGLILFTVVGVSATAVFPSNQTTYNNETTGMSATNVQTAIDELYNTCFPPTTADQVKGGLEKDPYECRYFFKGANPNNYITFNNETWRIISAECDGTIKIIKETSASNRVWDTTNSNNWTRPASINTYLNGTYYNGLSFAAKNQIVVHNWNIGPMSNNPKDLATQISYESQKIWSGKVALPSLSEYFRTNSNTTSCGALNVYGVNYQTCINSTWMDNNDNWWTLSAHYGNSNSMYYIPNNGSLHSIYVNNSVNVRPTLYLSANLVLSGTGSSSSPYTIK